MVLVFINSTKGTKVRFLEGLSLHAYKMVLCICKKVVKPEKHKMLMASKSLPHDNGARYENDRHMAAT